MNKDLQPADLVILDDAFQHRALKPTVSIVLIDYGRPIFKDHLLPLGHLRDLPERLLAADIIIVSKCPQDMNQWQKNTWAEALGLKNFNAETCSGENTKGKAQHLFFTTVSYENCEPVFPEGNNRYIYSKLLILFSGIANDAPLVKFLSSNYRIVEHFKFSDHHRFSKSDINRIRTAAANNPTAVLMTTEKDSQRMRDCQGIDEQMKHKLFYAPIRTAFLTESEHATFIRTLKDRLK